MKTPKVLIPPAPPTPVPQPSPQELMAVNAQTRLLDLQRTALQNALDRQKQIDQTLFSSVAQSAPQGNAILDELQNRTLQALRGQLPLPGSLERQFALGREDLEARAAQQFGPGYKFSTPYVRALADFNTTEANVRDSVQRGLIGESEALSLARQQSIPGIANQILATQYQPLQAIASSFGGAQGLLGTLTQSRLLPYQAQLQYQQPYVYQPQSILPTLAGAFTTLGSTALGSYLNYRLPSQVNFNPLTPSPTPQPTGTPPVK